MRTRLILTAAVCAAASSVALAAAPSGLRPLPMQQIPQQCHDLAWFPPSARTPEPELSAHISVANCWAMAELANRGLKADVASMNALDTSLRASNAILDDVIARSDGQLRQIAAASKADLYRGMVVRMRDTPGTQEQHAALERRYGNWLAMADRADRTAGRTVVGTRR